MARPRTSDAPSGVVPQFLTPGEDWRGDLVPVERWRRLQPPPGRALPDAPLPVYLTDPETRAEPAGSIEYGPGRLGRQLRTFLIPPTASEVDAVFPHIEREPPEPEEVSVVTPGRWRARQIALAYRAALKVVRGVGLDPWAAGHWLFVDAGGRWWALADEFGELMGPSGRDGEPECWFISGKHLAADAMPYTFFEALGGVHGPLEWAFEVVGRVRRLRRDREKVAARAADLRALLSLPEWEAFAEAVRRRGRPGLDSAMHRLQHVAFEGGDRAMLRRAFDAGFEFGDALGFLTAANAVRQSEAARNPGKVELRAALREIAVEEASRGPLQPYALAKALIREREEGTERGRRLGQLGLAADANRVGVMIREEATAAGLLRS